MTTFTIEQYHLCLWLGSTADHLVWLVSKAADPLTAPIFEEDAYKFVLAFTHQVRMHLEGA